jgi:penicillin amidase
MSLRDQNEENPSFSPHPHDPVAVAASVPPSEFVPPPRAKRFTPRFFVRLALFAVVLLAILAGGGILYARHWVRAAVANSLPQIDGSLSLSGLSAPVSVQRDAHGVPHIHAQSVDDLVYAQGFVTAQDRLFQMDTLRRHAAGELAAILGPSLIPHDKLQRTLQIRAAADRAVQQLPADQLHLLDLYAKGVNASIAAQSPHLPIEFRILSYQPEPWTPRDSILVQLAMFEDLTDQYEAKLAREALTAKLHAAGAQDLVQDLYPVGSWRDHPPQSPEPDLTIPGPPIEEVPLDESQASLRLPSLPSLANLFPVPSFEFPAGSNNWVVSGAHTASGKPLLSNDMHLNASVPGIWYETDLDAPIPGAEDLHVSGVTIPGLPLIVVGHNQHIAWGFTNLGADVQDIYIETIRGSGDAAQFRTVDGTWQPLVHLPETIKINHGRDLNYEVLATRHGDAVTPILTPLLKDEKRPLALRWTLYDPAIIRMPVRDIATAHDWTSFCAAFAQFGGPGQNVVYADDQGNIGYHATGRIPMRGPAPSSTDVLPTDIASPLEPKPATRTAPIAANPDPLARTDIQAPGAPSAPQLSGPLSPVPLVPAKAHEWSGYIPFDQLPQVFDPPDGVIATANARVTPDNYPYPINLDWGAPYRNERIWHLLNRRTGLKPADMLAIETDVYSDFDHVLAQRLAYALDHAPALGKGRYKPEESKRLHQAADLLRTWNGRMTTDSSAAAIVASTHALLWPALLGPHVDPSERSPSDLTQLYEWYEKDYALEQILMHTPPRWLPRGFASWDDFLTEAVAHALEDAKAPADLAKWRYGSFHTLDVEHPIFAQSEALRKLLGKPTGTGILPQSGDRTTVKQVGTSFGPSERFTADFSDFDHSTLNLVLGQSGNPDSPWFMDQFQAWYHGTTFPMPFSSEAVTQATTHTLTLTP